MFACQTGRTDRMVNEDEGFRKGCVLKRIEAFMKVPVSFLWKCSGMALLVCLGNPGIKYPKC